MIAIIGSSGFIGSRVKSILTEKGIENVGVYFTNPQGDLPFKLFINSDYVKKVSTLIICAGNSSFTKAYENFTEALLNELEYLHIINNSGFRGNFIYFSSAAVYHGLKGRVKEKSLIMPISYYSLIKHWAETFITMNSIKNNQKVIILRPTYVFGLTNSRKRLFDNILSSIKEKKILKVYNDDFYINPVSIEVIASSIYFFIKNDVFVNSLLFRESNVEIFNFGSQEDIRFYELLDYFANNYGLRYEVENKIPLNYDFIVDSSKIYNLFKSMNIFFPSTWEYIELLLERLT